LGVAILGALFAQPAPAAASNDSMTTPTALGYGVPQVLSTMAYTIESGEPNTTSPLTNTCEHASGGVGAARTAW
jgi:hypothetical protein